MGLIDARFAKWATGFSGCDGGDIGSPKSRSIWFCGIEWGGGYPDDVKKLQDDVFTENVEKPAVGYIDNNMMPAWKANLDYIFNWQAMKLLAAIHGQQTSTYKSFAEEVKPFVKDEIGYYKLNLYPLAFKNTSYILWKDGVAKATGFETKQEYIDWIKMCRFPIMKSWTDSYAPKLIVCAGITYSSDFKMAFVDDGLEWTRETHDERELLWVVNKNRTTVVVIPFMVNPNGLVKNISIQKFGDRIHEIIS